MLAQMREQGATVYDREAAIVLRAIEQGARGPTVADATATRLSGADGPAAAGRRPNPAPAPAAPASPLHSAVNLLC